MSNTNKRIINLETKQTLGLGDYLAADSEQGTYKVDANTNIVMPLTGLYDNEVNMGAVNLLPNDSVTEVINGVTFTKNADGSITANGTANANTWYEFSGLQKISKDMTLKMSGCPTNGSYSTYILQFTDRGLDNTTDVAISQDSGNGVEVSISANHYYRVKIRINNGTNVSNLVFKPMFTLASQPNSDYAHYVPYAKSNKELTDDIIPLNNSVTDSNDAYDSTKAYKVGDMVIHDDILYICTTACSAASWAVNSACFTATTLASVVTQLNSDLNALTKSEFGTSVNLASYTSNQYTCPNDGYVEIYCNGNNNVYLYINNTIRARALSVNSAEVWNIIPVKKGMRLKVSGTGSCKYYPLV